MEIFFKKVMYLIGIIRGQHLFVHTIWTIESDTTSLWARSLQSIVQFNELWANSGCTELGNHSALQSSSVPSTGYLGLNRAVSLSMIQTVQYIVRSTYQIWKY